MLSFIVFKLIFSFSKWPSSHKTSIIKKSVTIIQNKTLIIFKIKLQLLFVNILVEKLNQIIVVTFLK